MSYFIMEDASSSLRYVQPWNLVPSELEADWLPKVAAASRQEFPVRTCQRKLEVSVGMLTKLWADWVFRILMVLGWRSASSRPWSCIPDVILEKVVPHSSEEGNLHGPILVKKNRREGLRAK